ncbi:MAG TPA: hypothetical protein VGG89_01915 [Candidatus Baltobacteraceae bacterium]|jgi:hypothetical protein
MSGRWKVAILSLCAGSALLLLASQLFGLLGYGGMPRVGLWGMQVVPDKPFTFVVTSLDPGQGADRAGIRPGDVIDMRAQPLTVRFWLLDEPIAGRPATLQLVRGGRALTATVMPTGISVRRRPDIIVFAVAILWMIAFAALLVWRKPESYDVRLLSLTLICTAASRAIVNFSSSSAAFYVVDFLSIYVLYGAAVILWAMYCGTFDRPLSPLRRIVGYVCVALAVVSIAIGVAAVIGEMTLWFSADAYLHFYGGRSEQWHLPYDFAVVAGIVAGALAIGASRGEERQRAVWALVPLGLLFGFNVIGGYFEGSQTGYSALVFWIAIRNVLLFVVPILLTYAALGRRLLDVGFVANRALIFGIVSAIVVCVFLIVEWAANELLVNASRTTGTVFSMAVALGLGLSMRPIHRWTDRFVDQVFFRKRHEDEAALRRFAHEAAYITDRETLIERTVETVREHAYAATVSVMFLGTNVDENDRAIVALRTWHKPVDLDTLETTLQGEYAYPMLSRGRLMGALVCGPKADGESYAPDESAALFELAHGVGTALDLLGEGRTDGSTAVLEQLAALNRRLDALTELQPRH